MNCRSATVPSDGSRATNVELLSRAYCTQTIADKIRDRSHLRLARAWTIGTAPLPTGKIAMFPCSRITTVRSIGPLDELVDVEVNVAGNWRPAPMPGVRRTESK